MPTAGTAQLLLSFSIAWVVVIRRRFRLSCRLSALGIFQSSIPNLKSQLALQVVSAGCPNHSAVNHTSDDPQNSQDHIAHFHRDAFTALWIVMKLP